MRCNVLSPPGGPSASPRYYYRAVLAPVPDALRVALGPWRPRDHLRDLTKRRVQVNGLMVGVGVRGGVELLRGHRQ